MYDPSARIMTNRAAPSENAALPRQNAGAFALRTVGGARPTRTRTSPARHTGTGISDISRKTTEKRAAPGSRARSNSARSSPESANSKTVCFGQRCSIRSALNSPTDGLLPVSGRATAHDTQKQRADARCFAAAGCPGAMFCDACARSLPCTQPPSVTHIYVET